MLTNLLTAVAILTAPADAPIPPYTPILCHTLRAVALQFEMLDRRELRYVLTEDGYYDDAEGGYVERPGTPAAFVQDVTTLRKRWESLKDAPPLHDAMRFPSKDECTELLKFNRQCREHLEGLQRMIPATDPQQWEIGEAIREAQLLWQVWDHVSDAKSPYYFVCGKRMALMRARDKMGWDAYFSGNYPPIVPTWRFRRID